MTIRCFTLTLYPPPAPAPPPGASPTNHLHALAICARAQLDNALRDGRHHALRAVSRLLLDCHALLARLEQRGSAEAPTEKQLEYERELEYDRQAFVVMMQARTDLHEEFLAYREKVKSGSL